jgi:hypothetical protein
VHRRFANPWNANRYRPLAANGDAVRAKVNGEGGVFVNAQDGGTIRERTLQLLQAAFTNEAS